MKTHQLRSALKKHIQTKNIFKGVFAADKLPKYIPRNKHVCLIANTDPANKPGQHWVAFYYTRSHVFFFDSYGRPPMKPHFHRLMKYRKHQKFFGRRLQGNDFVCGHYCLYFILAMVNNWDFQNFGYDCNANDYYVREFVRRHFNMS